jgi:hypothetical protein
VKKSGVAAVLFTGVLLIIALSANAREGFTGNPDQRVLQDSKHHPVTTRVQRTDRNSRKVAVPGTLDIVFVISNALLGFLLLRRLNKR